MAELEAFLAALKNWEGEGSALREPGTAHAVVVGRRLLSLHDVPGLQVHTREKADGLEAEIVVTEGVRIARPIHLCFGVLDESGEQNINLDLRLESGSSAHFLAHCLFPAAKQVQHRMQAQVWIDSGAEMKYTEAHFHGPYGGVEVLPKATVRIGPHGRFVSNFTLTTGRVGKIDLDITVDAAESSIAELTTKIFGHETDSIKLHEKVVLNGANARGLIKSRIALDGAAQAEVVGITEGNAAGARGHVDCLELVRDHAVGHAIPMVSVSHPLAKVTHEAAIGSVDQQQVETLMAHGLSPEEAVDVIIKGILQ